MSFGKSVLELQNPAVAFGNTLENGILSFENRVNIKP
jgi:hypothetical protein